MSTSTSVPAPPAKTNTVMSSFPSLRETRGKTTVPGEHCFHCWTGRIWISLAAAPAVTVAAGDDVVIPAMRRMLQTALGADVSRAEPIVLQHPEANTIAFQGGNTRYEVLTIKEDTGEPHTVIAWRIGTPNR